MREAEHVFNRPALILRRVIDKRQDVLKKSKSFSLIDTCILLYHFVKYSPKCCCESFFQL